MPCIDRHLPKEIDHTFQPNPWEAKTATDETICMAMLETSKPGQHGFSGSHHAQCGHPRKDHLPNQLTAENS
jgi:hypothetical protein